MVSEAPPFWWSDSLWPAIALEPVARIYGRAASYRLENARRHRIDRPVMCVGNFTVGGAGKTPTALALAERALARGLTPGFLTRGYGRSLAGTHRVDLQRHSAHDVGDEPLMLAQRAPTVVAGDRAEGAARLIDENVDIVIMDDGFQSAGLHIDYALMVVDARRGIGNGRIIPAGPVRAPIGVQLRHCSALLKIGHGGTADGVVRLAARAAKPVYAARLVARQPERFAGRKVLAFAAIGDPEKVFRTLEEAGAEVVARRSFADHHPFSEEDIAALLDDAERDGLSLVTTAKDMARLSGLRGQTAELAAKAHVIEVDLVFDDSTVADTILDATVARYRSR